MAGKVGRSVGLVCLLIAGGTLCAAEERMDVCYGEKTGIVVYGGGWAGGTKRTEREIVVRDLAGTKTSVVCRLDNRIRFLELLPSEDRLAFMEVTEPDKPGYLFRLITLTGEDVARIPDTHQYSWSADGALVACLAGSDESSRELRLITSAGEDVARIPLPPRTRQHSWSPDETLVACLAGSYESSAELRLISSTGKDVARIPDVEEYEWSPDGHFVACIVGRYNEEYIECCGGFEPTATLIYEVAARKTTELLLKGEPLRGWELNWVAFDGWLYVNAGARFGNNVVVYDPVSQSVESTSHEAISFSPQGTYYCFDAADEGPLDIRLYRTRADEDITKQWPFEKWVARGMNTPVWLDDHTLVLSFWKGEDNRDILLDLDAGTARRASGWVARCFKGKDELLVVTPQGIITEKVSALEIIPPETTTVAPSRTAPGAPW